jgi:hypothetical protein
MKTTKALVLLSLFFSLFSCGNEESAAGGIVPATGTSPATEAAGTQAAAAQRRAVLARGNKWVRGIPGIADNAFPALLGEYRLEGLDPQGPEERGPAAFFVYISRESVFFSGDWQRQPGAGNNAVFQRFRGNDLLAAMVLEAGPLQGSWTVVFEFPGGMAAMGLEDAAFNRLIGVWTSRFLYFVSLIKMPGDVSLPAAVVF